MKTKKIRNMLYLMILIIMISSVFASEKYWNFPGNNISIGTLFINNYGNIGIGATSPKSKLDIKGGLSIDGQVQSFRPMTMVGKNNSLIVLSDEYNDGLMETAMTINGDGLPVAIYENGSVLKFIKCNSLNCSDRTVTTLFHQTTSISDMITGADGFPVIAYYNNSDYDLTILKCYDYECSSGTTNVIRTDGGMWPSMTLGTDGYPIISFMDSGQVMAIIKCGNTECSSGNAYNIIDNTVSAGWDSSIAIGMDGLPIIAYAEGTTYRTRVAKCSTINCSGTITRTEIDSDPSNNGPSLTIGLDGRPIIAYCRDDGGSGQSVRVLHCGNSACSSGNTKTSLITASNVCSFNVPYTQIAMGFDGLPTITYIRGYDGSVQYIKCLNTQCTQFSNNTISSSGTRQSMALGIDGTPVILYSYNSNRDIMFMKCANPYCMPYWSKR